MNTRFLIKDHAVRRYIERHAPALNFHEAQQALDLALATATHRKDRPLRRGVLFHLGELGVDVIAIPENRMHVVVTVLPALRDLTAELVDEFEEMQAYEARVAARAAARPAEEARATSDHNAAHVKEANIGSQLSRVNGKERARLSELHQTACIERQAAKDRLSALHVEGPMVRDELKTYRHAVTQWRDVTAYKAAAQIAIAALVEISDRTDPPGIIAARALERIDLLTAQFIEPEFYDPRRHPAASVERTTTTVAFHDVADSDLVRALLHPEASANPSDSHDVPDDVPTATCPRCGAEVPDHDGFGVLAHVAPAHHDGCGYCSHPSRDDGVCGICGQDDNVTGCACDEGACEIHDGPAPA